MLLVILVMDDVNITDKTAGIIHRKPTVHGEGVTLNATFKFWNADGVYQDLGT